MGSPERSTVGSEEAALSGQTALVTGAAKRLGRAIAYALGAEGVNVVLHYRSSADEARQAAGELKRSGVQAWMLKADLSNADSAAGLFGRAGELAGGAIDILVNSASIFRASGVLDFPMAHLQEQLQVNALSPLLLCRSFAAQGRPGQIVNMLDARMVEYDAEHVAYHLSKRMLFSLTRMLALELAPRIRVNGVAPGLILPPEGKDESYLQAMAQSVPLHQHGRPADVVRAVMFLLRSPFITGQVIYVDGGRHLRGRMYGS